MLKHFLSKEPPTYIIYNITSHEIRYATADHSVLLLRRRNTAPSHTSTIPCQHIRNSVALHCPGTETTESKLHTGGKHNTDNGNASDVRTTGSGLDKHVGKCTELLVAISPYNHFEHISGNGHLGMDDTIRDKAQGRQAKQEYQYARQQTR